METSPTTLADALLDSWDRQCRIVEAIAGRIDESTRKLLPSPDGWSLDKHLAHIHETRYFWLSKVSPERAKDLPDAFKEDGATPIDDLDEIKAALKPSVQAIREAMEELLVGDGTPVGGYDHPVLFLQHMVWHEGWHVGLLMLGLRLAGHEPPQEWEEANVWGEWRTE